MNGYPSRVLVSAGGGTVASSAATLSGASTALAPAISAQPADQTATAGAVVSYRGRHGKPTPTDP